MPPCRQRQGVREYWGVMGSNPSPHGGTKYVVECMRLCTPHVFYSHFLPLHLLSTSSFLLSLRLLDWYLANHLQSILSYSWLYLPLSHFPLAVHRRPSHSLQVRNILSEMAALHRLLNARGITSPAPSEEDQRRIDAKMQASGHTISPPIPTRLRSSRSEDQGQRPFHSKFNDTDFSQHPLYRMGDQNGGDRGNSFDDTPRPQLSRSATDDHLHQSYAMNEGRGGVDVSSYYEDGEQSPALSPALNKHLALRPLDPHGLQQQQQQKPLPQQHPNQPKHGRRRSRSATDDNLYYGGDREDNTVSKEHRKHKPRQESLAGNSPKPLPEKRSDEKMKERTIQLLRDRQQTATQNSSVGHVAIALLYNAQADILTL